MNRHVMLLLLALVPAFSYGFELNLDIDKIKGLVGKAQNLREVDEKGEVEIGSNVAANLLGVAPLVKDEKLQAYVNRIGLWLVMQTERPDLAWHFAVLDTDSVNAFAAPGGYVFVTRGLLQKMHSESELAGVLAHEIVHVLRRHHLQAIQKSAQIGLLADTASLAAGSNRHGEVLQKAISAGTELYARGLDKDDEFEADRMGVVIAARAGYDPYALPAVLQTLDAMNPQDGSLALMFKTHPAPAQRLQLLDTAMATRMDVYGEQPQVVERFQKMAGGRDSPAGPASGATEKTRSKKKSSSR